MGNGLQLCHLTQIDILMSNLLAGYLVRLQFLWKRVRGIFRFFFLNILILCNPLYSANINHSSYYLRSVFVFRISTVASHFPCFWIHSSGAGSDCQQLGAILLQQFHGSWGSACHFDYSVSGIVPHTILGIKNLLI